MIKWKEWKNGMKLKKGLYLVTVAYEGGTKKVCEAAYWNAYDQEKWTGFDLSETGMNEVYNVIAYAELPDPY